MSPMIQLKQRVVCPKGHLTRRKIVRNIFISVSVLFALARLLAAGTSDRVLNFGKSPLGLTQPPIITFDAPGAGTGPMEGTLTFAINDGGTIAGYYFDSSPVTHGFIRAPDGTFTAPIDAPGAGTGFSQGTLPENINASGAITGQYIDSTDVNHGFLRTPDGTITTFDAPGGGTGSGQGTTASCNNNVNAITGWYLDSNNTWHGFLREAPRLQPTPRPRPTPAPRP